MRFKVHEILKNINYLHISVKGIMFRCNDTNYRPGYREDVFMWCAGGHESQH